jgi:hypothetical protein
MECRLRDSKQYWVAVREGKKEETLRIISEHPSYLRRELGKSAGGKGAITAL